MVLPGEEAQLIIEEVANLLRHSATSAGGVSADQLRRLDSNQSSLMSDHRARDFRGAAFCGQR